VKKLREHDIRVESDARNESVGKKIREGRMQRVPYLVVIGDAEVNDNSVMVRNRETQEQRSYSVDEFISRLLAESNARSLKLSI
jgi:threonyl-tRNA synthetase